MRTLTLSELIVQAKERADLVRSGFVSSAEWGRYLNAGIAELWDELTKAYGEEYFLQFHTFTTSTASEYDLPGNFYQLRGLEVDGAGVWIPVSRFGMAERNKLQGLSGAAAYRPFADLQYALWGQRLKLIPDPASGQSLRMLYVPAPDRLATLGCPAANVAITPANTLTIARHGLRADQPVRPGPGTEAAAVLPTPLRQDTDYYAIVVDKDTIQLAASPAGSGTAAAINLTDAGSGTHTVDGVLDGVAGWEEWPILSAAIKAKVKGEDDAGELRAMLFGIPGATDQKDRGLRGRIESAAKQRDSNEPSRIVNAYAVDTLVSDLGVE